MSHQLVQDRVRQQVGVNRELGPMSRNRLELVLEIGTDIKTGSLCHDLLLVSTVRGAGDASVLTSSEEGRWRFW
ncbi:MAG TPA: hypothetical protein VNW73_05185 [Ktedonobacteraceae bacterium]|nr:hypothetical protein [Ktedonobacteraceae bacterium]